MDGVGVDLDDVRIFTKVVEAGSFTKAAAQLGMPKSSVSRRVTRLEAALRVRLINRSTRKLSLTQAGQIYFSRTKGIVEDLKNAELALEEIEAEPRGELRLTMPTDLAMMVPTLLAAFREEYPGVVLVVFCTNRRVDLVAEGYDLALRAGVLEDSSLVSRKLLSSTLGLYASETYLKRRGLPRELTDLANHSCLLFSGNQSHQTWTLTRHSRDASVHVSGPLASNDFLFLRTAALEGMGICLLPQLSLTNADGKGLVRVLPQYESNAGGLYAVYPSTRHLSQKVRAFIDFSVSHFGEISSDTGRR